MKKFFSLLLALTLVVGMLTAFTASAAVNTTTFYNALNGEQITSLDGVDSIYATTTFTGRYENNASVIVSHYAANGKLTKVESIVPVDSTIGASVTYTTPEISVADTDIIKIFAWTGVDTIKPLLKFPGVISRSAEIPLPTATVSPLNVGEITEVPLTFAMNFKADPATEAQLLAYGNWYADFELKVNKDVTFNLDGTADGYLAGQYDSWSPAWVQVPKKSVTLAANTPLKIMETGAQTYGKPGLKYTFQEVFDRVKDFDCGVFFTEAFLEANPDLHVTLELRMYNPLNEAESYLIGETYEFTCTLPTTTVTVLNAEELGLDYALNFSANEVTDGQLSAYADWKADYVLTVNKDLTLNANGTKDAYLAGQYDEFGPEFVKMPATETAIAANEAVSVLGLYGANITFRDVVETVKDFDCGIKFSDSFLAANPDVEAKLELRLYHPSNNGAYYVIGESYTFKQQQNITEEAQVLTYGNVTAEVPAGVLLNKGVTELALTTTALENSESGVEAGANETLSAMDVHVEGVSEGNTTPIIVTLKEATEPGYNKGNLSLFHVEDGVAVPMEEVETKADLVKHNQFTYDPADGTIAVALANFSEIALLATNDKAWNGEYDYSWYSADKTTFEIANADQLAAFGALVGGMADGYERDSFEGKTVKLISDINLNDAETNNHDFIFYPIGYYFNPDKEGDGTNVAYSTVYSFEGIFDGNGHTVANFYQNTWEIKGDYNDGYPAGSNYYKDGFGLFGYVYNGTVKNLIVSNFSSDGEFTPTGIIAAYAGGESTFENINVFNCIPRVYQTADGGIVGLNSSKTEKCKLTFRNITVDQSNTISALWGNWGLAAGNIMGWLRGNPENEVIMENCHAAAVMDVNNDICGNYHWYLYRYAGMYIGTIENLKKDTDGRLIPDLSGITAIDCTATFGSWNEYWYCELVENTIASYTHDHQFSRLERINSLSDIQDANGNWLRAGNFVIAKAADTESAVCYHVRKDANGNLYEHKHEDAGYETFDLNGDGLLNDLKEDRQHYYVPFNQMFNGYGDGIKPIYTVNAVGQEADPYPNIDIEIIEDGTVMSQEKFQYVGPQNIPVDSVVSIGDLWDAPNDDIVARSTVQVFVSPASEDSTVSAVYAAGVPDWEDGTLTFSGTGLARITITDYYYCTPTIAYVTVSNQPVDKFEGTTINKQLVYGKAGLGTVTVTLDELFDAVEGAEIDSANLTVTTDGAYTAGNTWAEGTVSFNKAGTYTVTINDNNLCNDATATVVVADAAKVDKWTGGKTANAKLAYGANSVEVNFTDLFTDNGYTKGTVTVTGGTYNASTGKVTVPCTKAGDYKVTITDNSGYCNVAESTVRVAAADPINKFTAKNPSVTHTLASIDAKAVSVKLGDIFGGTNVVTGNITVTIAGKATTISAADWANATVTIPGTTGDVTVTINDNNTCITATGKVTLKAPANQTKWTATNKTVNLTINTVGQNQTFKFADVFTAVNGAYIKAATVTVDNGGNFVNGVITVPGKAGTYTVTVTDNFYCNAATATITVNDAANVDKFTGKTVSKKLAYGSNTTTVTLGDLFTAGSYTIKDVTVTGGTYAKGATWDKGTVTVTGTGTFTITITDNYYCNTAKATLTVAAADPINKFTAKNPAVTHTLASMDAKAVSVKLGDIFSGTNVVTGNITVTIAGTTTKVTAADWANATVTIPGTTGDVTVTINDNNTCITATGKVTLKAPAKVDKWTTTNKTINLTLANYGTAQSINFADMFTAKSGAYIKTVSVTVNNGGSYASNKITVPGKAGTYTVTVTDNFYCNAATATITVNNPAKVTKWTAKTGLNYEVEAGASKNLTLADIFTHNGQKIGNVTYKVDGTSYSATAANWASKSITLGAGTHTITITDDLFSDGTYSATVKVTEKAPVEKFTVKDDYYFVAHDVVDPGSSNVKTIKLGDIFAASGEGTINSANVTVTTSNKVRKIEATINKNASDWTQTTIDLKYSGEITLTITDGNGCVAASAIVATAPKWVGDVDAGDASTIAQAHYRAKIKTDGFNVTVTPGQSKTFTLTNIPADGVYGIQWRNGYGIQGLLGEAEFTVNGYTDESAVTSVSNSFNGWSDKAGTDFLAYLKAGSNTITVKNVGSNTLTVYGNVNAMALDKSGYDDEDFLPYLKDNSDGEGEGGGTVTPPTTDTPQGPTQTWDQLGWGGSIKHQPEFSSWEMTDNPADITLAPGEGVVYTTKAGTYTGVYGMQLCIGTAVNTTVKIVTTDGYWNEYEISKASWTSGMDQDQPIYLHEGTNQIWIKNTGSQTVTITEFDFGGLNKDGNKGMKYINLVGTGETFGQ